MEEVLGVLLLLGIIVGGWILGIVGFARAGRALREVAALRAELRALQGGEAFDARDAEYDAGTLLPLPGQDDGAMAPPAVARGDQEAGASGVPHAPLQPSSSAVPPGTETAMPRDAGPPPSDGLPGGAEPLGPRPPPVRPQPKRNLEHLLTARWGIWAGALALLMSGVFLIRYAVEQSLLGPEVRCVLGFLLGGGLVVVADRMRRRNDLNPLAASALAAGALSILFGAGYGAGVLYELVPPALGFVLLAAISLAGLLLSLRFGAIVAVIGVVGAYATPALVDTGDPSLPGLFGYLSLVVGAALAVVRYTAWVWLGWSTTVAAAGWVLLALAAGPRVDLWAPALFVPLASALNLALLPREAQDHPIGRRLAWVPCAVLGMAGLIVALAAQGWDTRIGVLLMAPLTVWKAWQEPRMRLLPFLGATLFLLLLLVGWTVSWQELPDIVDSPARWRPASIAEFAGVAALLAGFFAASGLALWPRAPFPLPWASLTASVPVLTLAIAYARITGFQTRFEWAVAAFLLAAGLVGLTAHAMRRSIQVAGTMAAGAAAAIALGSAMVLSDHWLSVAIALLLPALALIEARTDLTPLRLVARAVAGVVLARLLLNWHVIDYAFGSTLVVNGLLAAYGVPALCFALAAHLFRRRQDDATVALLQAGAAAFATVLVVAEIRHGFATSGATGGPPRLAEVGLHVSALAVMALVTRRIAERVGGATLPVSWRIQGALALIGGVMLLIHLNPLFTDDPVGRWPILDWLLPAYLLPAGLAVLAARWIAAQPALPAPLPAPDPNPWVAGDAAEPDPPPPAGDRLPMVLFGYALVAVLAWLTLEIRHWFHGDHIGLQHGIEDAELWAWSGAWLAYGAGLLIMGLRRQQRAVRLAGIGIIALTTVKVFIVDMSALEGLWRVLSFLGLGLALIGLGAAYQRLSGSKPELPEQGEGPGPG